MSETCFFESLDLSNLLESTSQKRLPESSDKKRLLNPKVMGAGGGGRTLGAEKRGPKVILVPVDHNLLHLTELAMVYY